MKRPVPSHLLQVIKIIIACQYLLYLEKRISEEPEEDTDTQEESPSTAENNRHSPYNCTYDTETNLYYYRARSYDPIMGRFLQTDPMGYQDSMNLYQAFNMNGINFFDPLGLIKCIVAQIDAVGGPHPSKQGLGGDGIWAGPTDEGVYSLAYVEPHRSSQRYRKWSNIPYGSKIRRNEETLEYEVLLKLQDKDFSKDGKDKFDSEWKPLRNFTSAKLSEIRDYYDRLYGKRKIPDTWVFNDFGKVAWKMYKDTNQNGRIDSNERTVHGEFIHSTVRAERTTARGHMVSRRQMLLRVSHGCIHVRPRDIVRMTKKGYFKKGAKLIVHKYSEKFDRTMDRDPTAEGPYEIHFYPGESIMLIIGEK